MLTLNRNSNIPLSIQLKDVLLSGIRRGSLQINQRLPGERTLAKEYGVSRGTVIESLRILETQGYINRIEAKGTFVSANARLRAGTKKILFPFPASSLSIDCLGFSNWCASTEIYRGLIEGAMSYGLQLNMQFFDENQERIETYLNIKDADDFDAVFFISHQLSRLRKIIEERNIPHTVFLNRLDIDSKSYIYYKRLLASQSWDLSIKKSSMT